MKLKRLTTEEARKTSNTLLLLIVPLSLYGIVANGGWSHLDQLSRYIIFGMVMFAVWLRVVALAKEWIGGRWRT